LGVPGKSHKNWAAADGRRVSSSTSSSHRRLIWPAQTKPAIVVNAAAYTAVDAA
jgi:dTDP-4-dehydrorhamnose reductase